MKTKKHALVIFTKYPEPGMTKTRLMEENGGALTAEEAANFYKAMVLDTATVGCRALETCRNNGFDASFDFCISSSPEGTMKKVKTLFGEEIPTEAFHYVVDRGENFDEHFNDCYRQLFKQGYDSVVCIGGDLPSITPDLLVRAFDWLMTVEKKSTTGAMVLAPCQSSGVSLVGVTKTANMDFSGVFYNEDGVSALDALIDIAQRRNIPTALFESLFDVDLMEDLAHTITVVNAMEYTARFQPDIVVPKRTIDFIEQVGLYVNTPPNTDHDPRSQIDG
jgi:uncharacterized protein